uniref:Uncharacterized protein n=1 Tax=Anopheles culicifacies TaxID=139723 RepID=A0A182MP20_9DIPT
MGSKSSPLEDTPTSKPSLADIPASHDSSLESFSSTIECTPEPHELRPQTALQCLDHTIGIIWHCFDAFRQQIFTVSPESVEWAVDFLEASVYGHNDELHFVVAYLRCVQALMQLVFRKPRNLKNTTIEQLDSREHLSEDADDSHEIRQQEDNLETVPQNLIEELLQLYALLARYKEDIQYHQQNTIELKQLQEIEHLLHELNESFEANSGEEAIQTDWLRPLRM